MMRRKQVLISEFVVDTQVTDKVEIFKSTDWERHLDSSVAFRGNEARLLKSTCRIPLELIRLPKESFRSTVYLYVALPLIVIRG
jgi:hypothetical protein